MSSTPEKQAEAGDEAPHRTGFALPPLADVKARTPRMRSKKRRSSLEQYKKPVMVLAMSFWVVLLVFPLVLSLTADVFQRHAPEFPLIATILASAAFSSAALFVSALVGRLRCPGYKFYQPFVGGPSFVAMQCVGILTVAITLLVSLIYVGQMQYATNPVVYRFGLLSILGIFTAIGNGLVMCSTLYFVAPREGKQSERDGSGAVGAWLQNMTCSPNREFLLVFVFGVWLLVNCTAAETYPGLASACALILIVLHLLAGFVIHVVAGCWHTPNYRLLMPLAGSLPQAALQAFAWSLYVISLYGAAGLYEIGSAAWPSWHLAIGLLSIGSWMSLVLFNHLFRASEAARKNAAEHASRVAPTQLSSLGDYGPLAATVTSLLNAAVVWAICIGISVSKAHAAAIGSEKQLSGWQAVAQDKNVSRGLSMVQLLSILLLFFMPPCTHLLGRVAYGSVFALWVPFKGPVEFIVAQAVGWACFSVAIFFATLQCTESARYRFILVVSALLSVSQAAIHVSVHHFGVKLRDGSWPRSTAGGLRTMDVALQASLSTSLRSASHRSASSEAAESEHGVDGEEKRDTAADTAEANWNKTIARVFNGEMLTAISLAAAAAIMNAIVDFSIITKYSVGTPLQHIIRASAMASFIAVPLAHISMRDRVALGSPFVGSGGFVAMQVLAWAMYGINAVIYVLNTVTDNQHFLIPKELTDSVPTQPDEYHTMFYTIQGVFWSIPLVCMVFSSVFETRSLEASESHAMQAKAAARKLLLLLRSSALQGKDELATAEELLLLASSCTLEELSGEPDRRSSSAGAPDVLEKEKLNREAQGEAARLIVTIMCVAVSASFLVASLWSTSQPVFSLVFAVTGTILTTVSCVFAHYGYGTLMHGKSGKYTFFIPFLGGPEFVALQTSGWCLYVASLLLVLVSCKERQGSHAFFCTAGVFSVMAQYCILHSVSQFDPAPHPPMFVENNAEGIVAVLTLLGSFTFTRFYDMFVEGNISSGGAGSIVPIAVTAVCTCIALPMGLVSIKKSFHTMDFSGFSTLLHNNLESIEDEEDATTNDDETDGDPDKVMSRRASSYIIGADPSSPMSQLLDAGASTMIFEGDTIARTSSKRLVARPKSTNEIIFAQAFAVVGLLAVMLSMIIQVTVIYAVYWYVYNSMPGLTAAAVSWEVMVIIFCGLLGLVMLMELLSSRERSRVLYDFRDAICTYAIYSIPTYVVGSAFASLLLSPYSGSHVFALSLGSFAVTFAMKTFRRILLVCNVGALGYLMHYHIVTCLVKGSEPFSFVALVVDTISCSIWLWYDKRYNGAPHRTGAFRSLAATSFFDRMFFRFIAQYFRLRVVVDKDSLDEDSEDEMGEGEAQVSGVLTGEGAGTLSDSKGTMSSMHVDLSDPNNKYLFSFHPHGVFPGTALFLPLVEEWRRRVGSHKQTKPFVSTHCADIVFVVPFMRDFLMCLGSMSVSRRGIENSLASGNSVIIVTGGQSEMLLTRMSDTEMHLATHHTGFLRIAMTNKVPLVPLLVFAEHNVMDNVHCISIQRWFLKKIGFPFPTVPIGRWYLPLPTRTRLMVVVGRPITPQPGRDNAANPEHVEELRARYFKHIVYMFYKYREVAGYPKMELYLHDGVDKEPEKATPPAGLVPLVPLPKSERDARRRRRERQRESEPSAEGTSRRTKPASETSERGKSL